LNGGRKGRIMKYTELKINVDREVLELAEAALLGAGFDSLMIDDPEDVEDILANKALYKYDYINSALSQNMARKPQITLYFEDNEAGLAEQAKAKAVLADFGDKIELEQALTDDNDWLYKWQEYFKPTKVTDRLVVKPTWEEYEPQLDPVSGELEKVIEIDPGMAFGTGTHETTSMCMKALEKALAGKYGECGGRGESAGMKVLDVGCGSGILAIAAALLGAEEALGIEIDTDAVEVAKSNVQLNRLSDCIEIRYGDLTKGVDYTADIVVANLMADLVVMLTPDVANHLVPAGLYISSGILLEKEEMVSSAIRSAGFEILEVLYDGEWCAIVAQL